MKRVTGIGGIFFKCKNPEMMREWYKNHLGLNTDQYGTVFISGGKDSNEQFTSWSPFEEDTSYFSPSKKDFMINYTVEDLSELLSVLKSEGVEIVGEIQSFEYGKFAHILDPEGNKIELWEPKSKEFKQMATAVTK
tara:strand:+ start:16459 stop:16866 length:408 start_codon:yes stop_codon:yes gene_type:complete